MVVVRVIIKATVIVMVIFGVVVRVIIRFAFFLGLL